MFRTECFVGGVFAVLVTSSHNKIPMRYCLHHYYFSGKTLCQSRKLSLIVHTILSNFYNNIVYSFDELVILSTKAYEDKTKQRWINVFAQSSANGTNFLLVRNVHTFQSSAA